MRIVVNHLTRMRPTRICVAGIDEKGRSVRPVLDGQQLGRSLLQNEGGPFSLGAVVDLGRPRPRPVAPEVEDVVFDPRSTAVAERLDDAAFLRVLGAVAATSLRAVFGPELVKKSGTAAAVPQSSGNASLGVLRIRGAELLLQTRYEKPDLRVHFTDPDFGDLRIKVTDLRLWEDDHVTPAAANIERIAGMLDDCFLAVGLSRPFKVSSYEGIWHWLQINNVFPVADPLWERE